MLVPVFDHVRTVQTVVSRCRALGAPHILVVDDGSRDGSGEAANGDALIRHAANRGKGYALATGLATLAESGWRQVLTIDADLQHPPPAALALAQAAAADPDALWLGVRRMSDAPMASRLGRWLTGLGTWMACGVWPGDNQTGLRVWPLPAMCRLGVRAGRYAFEPESLVRAVRAGIRIRALEVDVDYPPDRISHFSTVRDSLRTVGALARLALLRR